MGFYFLSVIELKIFILISNLTQLEKKTKQYSYIASKLRIK